MLWVTSSERSLQTLGRRYPTLYRLLKYHDCNCFSSSILQSYSTLWPIQWYCTRASTSSLQFWEALSLSLDQQAFPCFPSDPPISSKPTNKSRKISLLATTSRSFAMPTTHYPAQWWRIAEQPRISSHSVRTSTLGWSARLNWPLRSSICPTEAWEVSPSICCFEVTNLITVYKSRTMLLPTTADPLRQPRRSESQRRG